jgi:hypothetical protein
MQSLHVLILLGIMVIAIPLQISAMTVATQAAPLATAFSSQRKLVRDSRGNLFAVYLKQDGNVSQVYLSQSTNNGNTWQELGRVSDGQNQAARVTIAIDGKDRVHIFWTKFIEEYGQITYRTYDHGVWSKESQITSGAAYSGYPSAALDSKGHIHLVWYGYDGTAYQVFYTMYDGLNWTQAVKLSQGYPDSVNPTIAVDSKDNLHVAWYKSNGRQYQIYYEEWSGAWGGQVILSAGQTDSFNPTLGVDQSDRVYVAWDKGEANRTKIYYAELSEGVWSQQAPLTSTDTAAENPSLTVDDQGNAYIFYDKADGQIYFVKRIADVWSPEERLTAAGINEYPSVRWSHNNNPLNGEGGSIDLVWTADESGKLSVQYANMALHETQPAPKNGNLTIFAGLVGGALIALTLFVIIHRKRNRLTKTT